MQDQFNHYTIIQDWAKKYSHATYLAAPTDDPERQVVLIVFASSLFSSPRERKALLEKAQSLQKLQHAHLVPILDIGIVDEQPFVVREYIPNQSLRSHLQQLDPKRLELSNALTVLLQIGEALAYAHSQNIFHGNIKPENILLDTQGQAFLTDFSLLKRADAMIRDQTSQEYAFCYQAPEQFTGTCDAYTDQYAMGCLAYELITGQIPFATQSLTSLLGGQYRYTQPAPLSEKVPDLVPSLEAAVLKTLAKDPSERFFDFSFFLDVIRSIVSPPPAFPILRSAASYKQKNLSRIAKFPKAPVDLVSASTKPATPASPLSQILETSNVISLAESESAEDLNRTNIDNLFNEEQTKDEFISMPLENDEMTIALAEHIDIAKPVTKRTQAHRRYFLRAILVGLLIAAVGAYATFSFRGADQSIQSVDTNPILTQQGTSVEIQSTIPTTFMVPPQSSLQATNEPKPTPTPQPHPDLQTSQASEGAPTPTPTPTPTPIPPAKIAVTITNLGNFLCAQVFFKNARLGNTVTPNDLQNHQNTITGTVTAPGLFSIDFYSTNDCSGTRGKYSRYQTTTDATYACDATTTNLCIQTS